MKKTKTLSDWMSSALTKEHKTKTAVSKDTTRRPAASISAPSTRKRRTSTKAASTSEVDIVAAAEPDSVSGSSELPWVTKHQPRAAADLAVHKKKIGEVQQWLEFALSPNARHPILHLTGPPGCGKTATLHALSQDLSFSVLEWVNQINSTKIEVSEDLTLYPESQSKQFLTFLTRANRYPTLLLGGQSTQGATRKVVLVEEFPNAFLRDPLEFHRVIKSVSHSLVYPLVFISSESHHNNSSSKLFTKPFLSALDIHTISFNPIAHTSLVKTLQKISTLECSAGRGGKNSAREPGNFHMPPREVIESLAESSAGDVRSAINSLQFTCLRDSSDLLPSVPGPSKSEKRSVKHLKARSSSSSKLKRQQSKDLSHAASLSIGGRDCSLFLFRALGKVLYCKRDVEAEATPTLPPSLAHCERLPLLVVPEDVLEHCHLSSDMFTMYLQQNYLDFFDSLENVTDAIAYLSDADLLSRVWSDSKETRAMLQSYSGSVACRGLMFTNKSTAGGRWRPLHKPQWNSVNRKYLENCLTARGLFLHLGASPFAHLWTPVELQTEILPFLAIVNPPLRNTGQASFLQTITHFKSNYQRLPVETLGEKDTESNDGDLPTPDGEVKGQNIPLSQSSASSAHPLSQDRQVGADSDMEIEDFDDDLVW